MIFLALIGFAAVLGLFCAANMEERKLLPIQQHIEQHPTDIDEYAVNDQPDCGYSI